MEIPFLIRKKFLQWIELVFTNILTILKSLLTTLVQEVWRFASRTVQIIFTLILVIFNKSAFLGVLKEQYGRIKTAGVRDDESEPEILPKFDKLIFKYKLEESESSGDLDSGSENNPGNHVLFTKQEQEKDLSVDPGTPAEILLEANGTKPLYESEGNKISPKEILQETADEALESSDSSEEIFEKEKYKDRERIRYDVEIDNKEAIFGYEKVTTGFFEDIKLGMVLGIERVSQWILKKFSGIIRIMVNFRFRKFIASLFDIGFYYNQCSRLFFFVLCWIRAPFLIFRAPRKLKTGAKKFLEKQHSRIDTRKKSDILRTQGYPYECHEVITTDGHILSLERLPRPNSTRVVYFQHGVIDSAFSWLAITNTIITPAFRAYELGYDVWAGTLRGCDCDKRHVNKNISSKEYWDFTVNNHAFQDLPGFIAKIREIKLKEFDQMKKVKEVDHKESEIDQKEIPEDDKGKTSENTPEVADPKKFTITVVAHSMGAMITLMYIIYWRMKNLNHEISAAILLSPAGCHKTAPSICYILCPLVSLFLKVFPFVYSFRIPYILQVIIAKVMEDIRKSYSSKFLLSYVVYKVLGGSKDDNSFTKVPVYTLNIFAGCSTGIFKHFYQIWQRRKFEGYDFGRKKNLQIYGTPKPIDFFENYDKIDIPIYFVMGLQDTLIKPISIKEHYDVLCLHHPELASLKAFPKMGHLDFTIGENSKVTNFIFEAMKKLNPPTKNTKVKKTPKTKSQNKKLYLRRKLVDVEEVGKYNDKIPSSENIRVNV